MAQNWSIKTLVREIMLSATYQQQSQFNEANSHIDEDNHYLWRMNRRRLEVEPWRDAMLAAAGNLDTTIGGPSVELSSTNNRRRTLYAAISRHNLDPLLRLFDFPDPNLTSDRRPVTSVPLQQLFVLNGEFIARQAETLAERLIALPENDNASRLEQAFVWVYGRPPRDAELQLGLKFIAAADTADPNGDQERRTRQAWQKYAQVLLSANEFAFID
jgi:hypothetical protein